MYKLESSGALGVPRQFSVQTQAHTTHNFIYIDREKFFIKHTYTHKNTHSHIHTQQLNTTHIHNCIFIIAFFLFHINKAHRKHTQTHGETLKQVICDHTTHRILENVSRPNICWLCNPCITILQY